MYVLLHEYTLEIYISESPIELHNYIIIIIIVTAKYYEVMCVYVYRCCGTQIIGCYAPTGEHCERPLEVCVYLSFVISPTILYMIHNIMLLIFFTHISLILCCDVYCTICRLVFVMTVE